VWDAATGQPLCEPMRHEANVYSAMFNAAGDRVLTSALDFKARIWDVRPGMIAPRRFAHGKGVRAAHFSPDGRKVLTASADTTAQLWDTFTGEPLALPVCSQRQHCASVEHGHK
jgi:WD40 repeat protein